MSLTIASLKYQETDNSIMRHIRATYKWLMDMSVLSGVSGKATVNGIDISGTLLRAANCTVDSEVKTVDQTGANQGTGYTALDVLTLEGGNGATVRVDTVGVSGEITAITLLTGGLGYENTGVVNATGGTGTDATINIATVGSTIDTTLVAKEIELNYYNLSFPVPHCELHRTWLSAFAEKYGTDEEGIFTSALIPYLAEKVNDEIRTQAHADMIAEATADANVAKVTLSGTIDTAANAFATVNEFIDGLPAAFLDEALDKANREFYEIEVSTEVFKLLRQHLDDKNSTFSIGGFPIYANKELTAKEMVARSWRNDLLVIDDVDDLNRIRVKHEEWKNKSYIMTGVAFKGSYIDSKRIVISN